MKTLKESILASGVAESILDGGPDRSLDNIVIFEKAKKWLGRYSSSVKGLKVDPHDGTLSADEIRFWGNLDLTDFPEDLHFKYIGRLYIDGCQHWNGTNYPDHCDYIYIEDVWPKGGVTLENFGDKEVDILRFYECDMAKDLKIPKNHNIKNLQLHRCNLPGSNSGRILENWESQCKKAHINLTYY